MDVSVELRRPALPSVQADAAPARQAINIGSGVAAAALAPRASIWRRASPWLWDILLFAYVLSGGLLFDARLALGEHVSVNQVLGTLSLAHIAYSLFAGRSPRTVLSMTWVAAAALTLVLALRALDTPNAPYGRYKVVSYATMVLPMLLHVQLHVRRRGDVERVLWVATLAMFALVASSIPHMQSMQGGQRLAVLGGGPNTLARHIGTGLIAASVLLGLRGRRDRRAAALVAGLLVAAVALFLTGTKAVLLSLGLTSLFFFWRLGRRKTLAMIIAVLLVAALLPLATHDLVQGFQKDGGLVRLLRLPDVDDPNGSYGSRLRYVTGTWDELRTSPWLGVGTGAWGMQLGLPYDEAYPHNIFLEVVGELGVVGLALVLGACGVYALRRGARRAARGSRRGLLAVGIGSLLVYWTLNVQFSGDLVDSRYLWLWLAMFELHRRIAHDVVPAQQPIVNRPTHAQV